jgi:PQQ-like domain
MELFGYLCSAACRGKAELQGIRVPVYARQKALVERRRWRRIGLVTTAACLLLVAFLGVWFWYAWFGSRPRVVYSVRFDVPAYAGTVKLCGNDQLVFLHGGTLARHDMKTKRQIWSRELIDKEQIAQQVQQELKELREHKAKTESDNPDLDIKIPSVDKLTKSEEEAATAALELYVRGQNIWVASPEELVRYDWDTGQPGQEISLNNHFGGLIPRGDELLTMQQRSGEQVITHINLTTGQTRDEEIALPTNLAMTRPGSGTGRSSKGNELAGLPVGPAGTDSGKPFDPRKVSEDASRLSLPSRIALPAVLAINRNQERALAEMNGTVRKPAAKSRTPLPAEAFTLIPAKTGNVQFAARLIEERLVTRTAMKAPPKKSALEGAPTVANTTDIANEILNEMQRNRGGGTVTEDESRYQVTIRMPDAKDVPDWTAEVIGPPALFPLETVNVLAAGKTLIVLNKQNKKLWETTLSYPVGGRSGAPDEADAAHGLGPCVERNGRLYVFDQGMLSDFDLKTGNAQWRLPSVGITGLFFDEAGMLYVNTTTANYENLKYSRQIDVSQKISGSVIKVDPQTGKTLWVTQSAGMISYLSGNYIYSVQSYRPPDEDSDNPYTVDTGFETPPYLRIRRINPKNGHEMWEHFEQRAPLDVQFDKNSIQLVFKKEVEVLKFLSW